MPRGRPRRNKKPKTGLINTNGGTEDIITEGSETEARIDDVEDHIEVPAEEDDDDCEQTEPESEFERPAQRKKLTEGKIDVDEDVESDESGPDAAEGDEASVKKDGKPVDVDKSLEKAANACRLPPKSITPDEYALLPFLESVGPQMRSSFLVARNSACLLWMEDSTLQVTVDRLVGFLASSCSSLAIRTMHDAGLTAHLTPEPGNATTVIPPNWNPWCTVAARHNLERLAHLAVLFLERFGYINFGNFKVLSPPLTQALTGQFPAGSNDKTRRSVAGAATRLGTPLKLIVCGAGAAGLIAARQLTYFGAKVTVLESRDRIGGRVWTYKQNDQFADLGAMIITGLVGNPSTFLAHQGGLDLDSISQWCVLYGPNGRPVSKDKDERMEEEFNRLLATAAHLAGNKSPTDPAVANLSLGGVIDDLIRYQENHILPLKTTHKKLVLVLLERKTRTLNQMAEARKVIEDAFTVWKNCCKSEEKVSSTLEGRVPAAADGGETASSDVKPQQSTFEAAVAERRKRTRASLEGADSSSTPPTTTTAADDNATTGLSVSPAKRGRPPRRNNNLNSSSPSATAAASSSAKPPVEINADDEFEKRRLMSELHQAWKYFDPLQCALAKINRQLDVLSQNPPRDVYLTASERNLMDWHLANLEFANATELKNLSLFHWDQDDAFELPGCHATVRGGFGQLLEVLTSAPCGQIEVKSSVKAINVTENGVSVESLNAALSEEDVLTYDGDAVLCALPLGVLKAAVSPHDTTAPRFNPPLPHWKVGAIERLGFGVLNKVVLFFDRFFWDRSQRFFGSVHDSIERRGELFLFWSITDQPCLIALVAGKAAVNLEADLLAQKGPFNKNSPFSDQAIKEPIVERAMNALRKIFAREFSGQIPEPMDAVITRWSADPESRGSYSYVAVGATGDDYDLLGAPLQPQAPPAANPPVIVEGDSAPLPPAASLTPSQVEAAPRLFFAGEHTCRFYPASVHGAMFSGMREVARMASCLFPGETPVREHGFTLSTNTTSAVVEGPSPV